MFKKLVTRITGDPSQKVIAKLRPVAAEITALEPALQQVADEALKEKTAALKARYAQGEGLDDLAVEAFALVREASRRSIGLRHYDVQLMGGMLLHQGEVVEMRTGEGKTLVATLPLYLNALTGEGVHLVTVNEYLARRDGGWMGNIFHTLGLTVGVIGPQQISALFDPEYVNPGAELEDERLVHWRPCTRQQAYLADITYGISSEFGFDYLRDNMATNREQLVQRGQNYAIIDEVDNILIDEARTPLIISGPAARSGKDYLRFAEYVRRLRRNTVEEEDEEPNGHYDIDEKSRSISLTEMGLAEIEKRIPEMDPDAGDSLYDPRFYQLTYYLDNAIRAEYIYKRDVDYVVQSGEVLIIDDFTGRLMPGRRYSDGLHEAIEAKENVTVRRETVTVATITLQNYFRLYDKLAGMTGTALTDAEEFDKIYELGVTPLPTNVEYIVETGAMGLETRKERVESAEVVRYVRPGSGEAVYFKRLDFADQVYGTSDAKDQAIISEIKRVHELGRPSLVGTTSVEHSEVIHRLLNKEGIPHNVLNAKLHQSEALTVAQAGRKGAVTISTNMAGRGTDILLGGNPEGLAAEVMEKELFDRPLLAQLALHLLTDGEEAGRGLAHKNHLLSEDLVDGLLQVKAEFDAALTEIEEVQVIGYLARTLQAPYDIEYDSLLNVLRVVRVGQLGQARDYVESLDKDAALVDEAVRLFRVYSDYQSAQGDPRKVAQFLSETFFERHYNARAALIRAVLGGRRAEAQHLTQTIPGLPATLITRIEQIIGQTEVEKKEVWQLGGLHVVGSERHESRRIDNQLRGRAARQGDPGSSRFFLSLEDDLMRRFGGERLKNFMARTSIPDDMPLEYGVLDRLIENAQERIEGYNFDIRKNVVEYDDVMNRQRQSIYDERRTILNGEAFDLDAKMDESFAASITELVDNYVNDYTSFVRGEIERVINAFSTDATNTINLPAVLRQLSGLLPGLNALDREELERLSADRLADRLMILARHNEEEGANLLQLLQAMGRFLPLLPPVPNLGALAMRKSGQAQARENIRRHFLEQVQSLFEEFLAEHVEQAQRDEIWERTAAGLSQAFMQFNLDSLSLKNADTRQAKFKQSAEELLRALLIDSLSTLDGEQLETALKGYVHTQQEKWRAIIGEEQYRNFQRLLLLSATDAEWRDYLTAMDDLRREVGLEAIGQRDPKVQYKRRSFEMFADMRHNIEKSVADRFFREIVQHQQFIQQQQAEVTYQLQAQEAGFQVVKREKGKGVELRRDMPKVGRNDPCPCGSGKKYKNCHGRAESATAASVGAPNGRAGQPAAGRVSGKKSSTKKRKARR